MSGAEIAIDTSNTSEISNTQGKECTVGRFVTPEEGWKIVKIAESWEGTAYKSKGAQSVKGVSGDCSGSTNKIYIEAGFPYPYQMTSSFVSYSEKSNRFREIDPKKESMQAGDVLFWRGHMALFAPLPEGHPKRNTGVIKRGQKKLNNMYTAFNENSTHPYGPYNIETFRSDPYRVFRYLVMPCVPNSKK